MVQLLVQSNFACVLMCLFLLIFTVMDHSFSGKVRWLFFVAALTVIVLTASDSTDYCMAQMNTPSFLRHFTTATGYALRPLTIYAISLTVHRKNKKNIKWIFIPFLINFILSYISMFAKIMFSFDSLNQFHREMLWILPFAVSGFYIFVTVFWNIREFHQNGNGESIMVFVIAFISAAASVMESLIKYKFILNGAMAVCLTFYYLYLYIQIYKCDALTGLLNRRSFNIYSSEHLKKKMIIVSLDLNNLKSINDNYGHSAGDEAIINTINIILKYQKQGCRLYRVGGDEFMMICRNNNISQVNEMLSKIDSELEKTPYSIASGASIYVPGMNFEDACGKADELMYINKRKSKMKNKN